MPSTTWAWKRVKISRAPQAQRGGAPKAPPMRTRPNRDRREPLTVTVSYRGGPEAWYEIHARGAIIRVPGHRCLHDVMESINRPQG